jgi:hypothetical protein
MSRYIVPVTFLFALLPGVVLPLAVTVYASGPSTRVPSLLGSWDGFFHDVDGTGDLGVISSVIDRQDNKRFRGNALLFDTDRGALFNAINYSGTVAQADFLNGEGRTLTGRAVFHADLETIAGAENDAAVMEPLLQFVPSPGPHARVPAILLRPFSDPFPPNIAGVGVGIFRSQRAPDSPLGFDLHLFPNELGTGFHGELDFLAQGMPPLDLLATTSNNGRFVMIAQGRTGRLVAEGTVLPAVQDQPTMVNAFYRFIFTEGAPDFGAINFHLGL